MLFIFVSPRFEHGIYLDWDIGERLSGGYKSSRWILYFTFGKQRSVFAIQENHTANTEISLFYPMLPVHLHPKLP